MKTLTDKQKAELGAALAEELNLSRSPAHRDRWNLTTGDKTDLGLFNTVARRIFDAYGISTETD